MSLFKLKRGNDGKTSKQVSESDSKSHKSVTGSKLSSTGQSASSAASSAKSQTVRQRSTSVDMTAWLDKECPVDNRMISGTTNTLSISRSGRCKAKGKQRARLFSEDFTGSSDDQPNPIAHLKTSHSATMPEVRPDVLESKDKKSEAKGGAHNGRNSTKDFVENESSQSSSRSPKWSTTSHSTDL